MQSFQFSLHQTHTPFKMNSENKYTEKQEITFNKQCLLNNRRSMTFWKGIKLFIWSFNENRVQQVILAHHETDGKSGP